VQLATEPIPRPVSASAQWIELLRALRQRETRFLDYLPIFLKLQGARCVVVGGGSVAERKVDLLRAAGAVVEVVAPELGDALSRLRAEGSIHHTPAEFQETHLAGATLVIAATDDSEINRSVAAAARRLHIPVNVVDDPTHCSFVMPAIIDRSPLVIAISSGGSAPVLARQLRERFEAMLPQGYAQLARLAGEFRAQVKSTLGDPRQRRRFWESVFRGTAAERIMAAGKGGGAKVLEEELGLAASGTLPAGGEVYLVGGGPGDPDLLTFKALRLMQQSDVVVYDRLVSAAVLSRVRRDAQRIYVGKARDQHPVPQEQINQILVEQARKGQRVLRLKGGDPFVFGRGGEEIDTLRAAGIPFQVVPGITAALGCAAYAGIPLTHRDHAQACLFVTGHLRDGSLELPWKSMVQPGQTVVVYMGLGALPALCAGLSAHGLSERCPVALVEQGTTEHQRVLTGTVADIASRALEADLKPPTLVIIGSVVRLRDKLRWFTGADTDTAGECA
jgi:uroporphyrin-III C-methyltransferase/precorrin-2 dehydrogenase/sirohydrochlorin ferrochelatase